VFSTVDYFLSGILFMPVRVIRGSFLLLFPENSSLLSVRSVAKAVIPLEASSDLLQNTGYTRAAPHEICPSTSSQKRRARCNRYMAFPLLPLIVDNGAQLALTINTKLQ